MGITSVNYAGFYHILLVSYVTFSISHAVTIDIYSFCEDPKAFIFYPSHHVFLFWTSLSNQLTAKLLIVLRGNVFRYNNDKTKNEQRNIIHADNNSTTKHNNLYQASAKARKNTPTFCCTFFYCNQPKAIHIQNDAKIWILI